MLAIVVSDARAADYDAIVFVGGHGLDTDDPEGHRIAQEAVAEGKVLAAIRMAPITLAKAGVLKGKQATVSTGPTPLKAAGA